MKINYLAICIALAASAGALPAMADDGYTPSKNGYIGGATGFAVGAGATGYYLHRQGAKAAAQTGGLRIRMTSASQMKDAAGRLDRHTDAKFNKKYLDTYGEEHARAIDKAKREQALKNEAKRKELHAQKKLDRKLAKENPDAARKLKRERRAGEKLNAHQKHKKDMRALERKVGAEKGTAKAHIKQRDDAFKAKQASKGRKVVHGGGEKPKFGSVKPRGNKVHKNPTFGSTAPRAKKAAKTANSAKKAGKTARTAKKVAKAGKTARKLKTVGKVAAGGAAGMVAGAAMGEHIPDAFDAAAYTYKMARNPKDAPKMLANTAKGGVAMAGRMALTVTDPGKMARNLGGAAQGVGRSIANTGVYKSIAKTKTGRTIGKATTWTTGKVSQGYKSFARTKTGRTLGAAAKTVDKYTFKQANKGVRVTGKAISKGSKVVGKVAKNETKKAKKTARKIGKSLKKAFHF